MTTEQKPLIAMMLGWEVGIDLLRACAVAAAYHGADFYYFRTSGIKEQSITGIKLENDQWIEGEFRYPDAIYDYTRRRGIANFEKAYSQIGHIPMGHTIKGRSMNKSKVYRIIQKSEALSRTLIPYMTVRDSESLLQFMEKHGKVIFKTNGGYLGRNALTAELKNDVIELFDQKYLHRFSLDDLPRLTEMLTSKRYFVQKMIHSVTPQNHPFHVRVHVCKNGENRWIVAFHSIGLSLTPHVKVTNSDSTYRGTSTWQDFLRNQFGEKENGAFHRRIDNYSVDLANYLEEATGGGFHEIGFDFGVDDQKRFWLFEAGIGLPGTSYYHLQMAMPAVAYTLSLLK
ncbi:YheC/YheD family protein [Saccharibacillus sp. JS10]|uniref:YheC/YheD family protein n=1 Tax=Saccharibacillus sp. JS10 TaxID=2950552 RepID=UPI00210A4083|nr:YheC/YheD family protein [Saccharibacillus sp. JS10]MCQ4088384.1 YheC/YheD family protein [Saccharibacillus sp. JS10]